MSRISVIYFCHLNYEEPHKPREPHVGQRVASLNTEQIMLQLLTHLFKKSSVKLVGRKSIDNKYESVHSK